MSSREKIVEMLAKLLRLSKSANQHEAELAMERAFDLAQRHQIDLDSINLDDEERRIVHERVKTGWRLTLERRLAINLVGAHFNVRPIFGRPEVTFIGTATDIAMAKYVVEFLVTTSRRCLGQWEREEVADRRRITANKRHYFTAGFFYGISSKLGAKEKTLAIEQPRYALIVRDADQRRKEYSDEHFDTEPMEPIRHPRKNRAALVAGFIVGKQTEIGEPLGEAAAVPLLEAAT